MAEVQAHVEESEAPAPSFTIVTGLSGAGRTEAANALEDIGYFVVDNLPPALMGKMVELSLVPGEGPRSIAFVIDVRGGAYFDQLAEALRDLARRGVDYRILFLTASDEVLIRRFDAKRRKHPLADRVIDGITKERAMLESLREAADLVVDTSQLSVHNLRERIVTTFSSQSREERMRTTVLSFGFKHGLPMDADMVLDCRYLPNPHWVENLRPLPGTDPRIREYVLGKAQTTDLLDRLQTLFEGLVPGFLEEGKRYLTVAIGCTGGRHRSVVLAEELAVMLRARGLPVAVRHRDLDRE
ncbi:MAG: RNase adapter RapZ [Actinomycetota bacterium]